MIMTDHKNKVVELDKKIEECEKFIEFKESKLKAQYQLLKLQNPKAGHIELFSLASEKTGYDKVQEYKKGLEQLKNDRLFHYLMGLEKKYMNEYLYSDINPYEVVGEITEKYFMIRPMKCTVKKYSLEKMRESFVPGGFLGHTDNSLQEWKIESDESAPTIFVRLRKDGYWYMTGGSIKFHLSDKPIKFHDYNF